MSISLMEILGFSLLAFLGVLASAMFSGLETGVYTLNRVRLHVLSHEPRSAGAILARLLQKPNRLLGTLLISNNAANYAASLGIAAVLSFLGYTDWAQVIINAAILTPVLFVLGEVLPKDLFANYSDRLTYRFAWMLLWLQRLLMVCGLLPLIEVVNASLQRAMGVKAKDAGPIQPRRVMTALFREGVGHGVLSPVLSDVMDRVLHPTSNTVGEVMQRWANVQKLYDYQPVEAAIALANRSPYTRYPLLNRKGQLLGVVDIHQLLMHHVLDEPRGHWTQHVSQVMRLSTDQPVREALEQMQRALQSSAVVEVDGRIVGWVSIKDLVEPIIGELASW